MRLPRFVVLALVTFLVDIKAPLTAALSKVLAHSLTDHWRHSPTRRLIRFTPDEERGITVPTDELANLLKKGESADAVFKLMTLDKVGDDLLNSPQLTTWITYMMDYNAMYPKNKQISLISILRKNYPDEDLIRIIETAKKVPSTEGMASNLQLELTQKWLTKGISPGVIFKAMALDKVGDDLLNSPKLTTWITYMKDYNAKYPKNRPISLFSTLMKNYPDDDLVRIMEKARKVSSTKAMAERFQLELVHKWLAEMKTPQDIFTKLRIEDVGNHLFKSPRLELWVKYVDNYNKNSPDKDKVNLMTILKTIYMYNDENMVNLLIEGKKVAATKKLATRVQTYQMSFWLGERKPPSKVFELLKLNEAKDASLLENTFFKAWFQYSFDFRSAQISTLKKYYTDDVIADIIIKAREISGMDDIAQRLHTQQFAYWLASRRSPDALFSQLYLGKTSALFENPRFFLWIDYVSYFSDRSPKLRVDMLTILTVLSQKIGEEKMIRTLMAATHSPVRRTKSTAIELLKAQFKQWLEKNTDPLRVHYLVRGNENPANALVYKQYKIAYTSYFQNRKNRPRNS
ncbi:Avirulence (Avh) protein [Phytophthora megakarya]|uniref:Avirulence (Avh) protein n=1 Tax=Phytophthora megakarya TaxID=4795 RepID=A0A225V0X2_9STRA|nr:Avirulence (Avh) protein [Phytophthora megakarya]